MSYIYCITNIINNKKYVGKSTDTVEKRWKEHCKDCFKERCEKRPLYDAMQKYGLENFKIEIVQECNDDESEFLEMFWIQEYNTYRDGYNATLGGDGKILFDYQSIIDAYNSGLNVKMVAEKIGCCTDTAGRVLRLNNINTKTNRNKAASKAIMQLDLNGNYIATFISTMEAIHWLYDNGFTTQPSTGNSSHLGKVANGKAKTAYKFKWKWV